MGIISLDFYDNKGKPLEQIMQKDNEVLSESLSFIKFIMGRDLNMKIPTDLAIIDTNNLGELIWWSAHLGVGPEKLLDAIGKVGNKIEVVRNYIRVY